MTAFSHRRSLFAIPAFSFLAVASASAQVSSADPPQLLADLQLEISSQVQDSDPQGLAISGNTWLFAGGGPSSSEDLWLSDGTAAGTRPLPDLTPGTLSEAAQEAAVLPNGNFVVSTNSDAAGRELFLVDPSNDSLTLIEDLRPGAEGSDPRELVPWNGRVWFTADDGGPRGRQVWRTDGTAAGTTRVTSLFLMDGIGDGALLRASSGSLFLASVTNGRTLWAIPASGSGVVFLLKSFSSSPFIGPTTDFGMFTTVGGRAVFSFFEPTTGLELWSSDGTVAGTQAVSDLNPGGFSSDPCEIATGGGLAWFGAFDAATGWELYTTDGTTAGTTGPIEVEAGPGPAQYPFSNDAELLTSGLVFSANTTGFGAEPWVSDGTTAGTQRLADLEPGELSSLPRDLVQVGGVAYFVANRFGIPRIFRSDGTSAGTVFDQDVGSPLGQDLRIDSAGTQSVFLAAGSSAVGFEPHVFTPGAPAQVLANVAIDPENQGSEPGQWIRVRDQLYFMAESGGLGRELWRTNGTQAGTSLVEDLNPGVESPFLRPLTALGERLIFTAAIPLNPALYATGPTGGATQLRSGANRYEAAPLGDIAIALELPSFSDGTLLRTDGTPGGTVEVPWPNAQGGGPFQPTLFDPEFTQPTTFDGKVWFFARDSVEGFDLWSTDGTTSGTRVGLEIVPGLLQSVMTTPIPNGDLAFVIGQTDEFGREPYLFDGQSATLVADLSPGSLSTFIDFIEPMGDDFVFRATPGTFVGHDLWRTDGVGQPPVQLDGFLDVEDEIIALDVAGDHVFFWTANPSLHQTFDLWVSDGTPGAEILAGSLGGVLEPADLLDNGFLPIGSDASVVLYPRMLDPATVNLYVARAEADSLELYVGYPDSLSGPASAPGLRLGGEAIQQSVDPVFGAEPHVFSLVDLGGWVAEPYGQGCGVRIGSNGEARIGQTLDITLERADPLAASGLFLSFEQSYGVLGGGCTAQIGAVAAGFAVTTDASGSATVPLAIPNQPSLVGIESYWQWASLSVGGPFSGQAVLSGGLEVVIGG